jgi:hypothetical protein
VSSPQTFVRIRWEYIGLLTTQIGLTSCFLAAVVIVTVGSKTQALKGSPLVTMTALSNDTKGYLMANDDLSQTLADRAKNIMVRLESNGADEKLELSVVTKSIREDD